jgi:hypothetical protein
MIAQNGAGIRQSTKISVSGCKATASKAQRLAKALKACARKGKGRASCARSARAEFGVGAKRGARKA